MSRTYKQENLHCMSSIARFEKQNDMKFRSENIHLLFFSVFYQQPRIRPIKRNIEKYT